MAADAHDDLSIGSEETLIRRINPDEHVVLDENAGVRRISTKAISSSSVPPYGMSVDVLSLIERDKLDAVKFVTSPKYTASIRFSVGTARTSGLWVGLDPLEKDGNHPANPYHAEVWSQPDPSKNFTKGQRRAILNASEWFVDLPGVEIPRVVPEK